MTPVDTSNWKLAWVMWLWMSAAGWLVVGLSVFGISRGWSTVLLGIGSLTLGAATVFVASRAHQDRMTSQRDRLLSYAAAIPGLFWMMALVTGS